MVRGTADGNQKSSPALSAQSSAVNAREAGQGHFMSLSRLCELLWPEEEVKSKGVGTKKESNTPNAHSLEEIACRLFDLISIRREGSRRLEFLKKFAEHLRLFRVPLPMVPIWASVEDLLLRDKENRDVGESIMLSLIVGQWDRLGPLRHDFFRVIKRDSGPLRLLVGLTNGGREVADFSPSIFEVVLSWLLLATEAENVIELCEFLEDLLRFNFAYVERDVCTAIICVLAKVSQTVCGIDHPSIPDFEFVMGSDENVAQENAFHEMTIVPYLQLFDEAGDREAIASASDVSKKRLHKAMLSVSFVDSLAIQASVVSLYDVIVRYGYVPTAALPSMLVTLSCFAATCSKSTCACARASEDVPRSGTWGLWSSKNLERSLGRIRKVLAECRAEPVVRPSGRHWDLPGSAVPVKEERVKDSVFSWTNGSSKDFSAEDTGRASHEIPEVELSVIESSLRSAAFLIAGKALKCRTDHANMSGYIAMVTDVLHAEPSSVITSAVYSIAHAVWGLPSSHLYNKDLYVDRRAVLIAFRELVRSRCQTLTDVEGEDTWNPHEVRDILEAPHLSLAQGLYVSAHGTSSECCGVLSSGYCDLDLSIAVAESLASLVTFWGHDLLLEWRDVFGILSIFSEISLPPVDEWCYEWHGDRSDPSQHVPNADGPRLETRAPIQVQASDDSGDGDVTMTDAGRSRYPTSEDREQHDWERRRAKRARLRATVSTVFLAIVELYFAGKLVADKATLFSLITNHFVLLHFSVYLRSNALQIDRGLGGILSASPSSFFLEEQARCELLSASRGGRSGVPSTGARSKESEPAKQAGKSLDALIGDESSSFTPALSMSSETAEGPRGSRVDSIGWEEGDGTTTAVPLLKMFGAMHEYLRKLSHRSRGCWRQAVSLLALFVYGHGRIVPIACTACGGFRGQLGIDYALMGTGRLSRAARPLLSKTSLQPASTPATPSSDSLRIRIVWPAQIRQEAIRRLSNILDGVVGLGAHEDEVVDLVLPALKGACFDSDVSVRTAAIGVVAAVAQHTTGRHRELCSVLSSAVCLSSTGKNVSLTSFYGSDEPMEATVPFVVGNDVCASFVLGLSRSIAVPRVSTLAAARSRPVAFLSNPEETACSAVLALVKALRKRLRLGGAIATEQAAHVFSLLVQLTEHPDALIRLEALKPLLLLRLTSQGRLLVEEDSGTALDPTGTRTVTGAMSESRTPAPVFWRFPLRAFSAQLLRLVEHETDPDVFDQVIHGLLRFGRHSLLLTVLDQSSLASLVAELMKERLFARSVEFRTVAEVERLILAGVRLLMVLIPLVDHSIQVEIIRAFAVVCLRARMPSRGSETATTGADGENSSIRPVGFFGVDSEDKDCSDDQQLPFRGRLPPRTSSIRSAMGPFHMPVFRTETDVGEGKGKNEEQIEAEENERTAFEFRQPEYLSIVTECLRALGLAVSVCPVAVESCWETVKLEVFAALSFPFYAPAALPAIANAISVVCGICAMTGTEGESEGDETEENGSEDKGKDSGIDMDECEEARRWLLSQDLLTELVRSVIPTAVPPKRHGYCVRHEEGCSSTSSPSRRPPVSGTTAVRVRDVTSPETTDGTLFVTPHVCAHKKNARLSPAQSSHHCVTNCSVNIVSAAAHQVISQLWVRCDSETRTYLARNTDLVSALQEPVSVLYDDNAVLRRRSLQGTAPSETSPTPSMRADQSASGGYALHRNDFAICGAALSLCTLDSFARFSFPSLSPSAGGVAVVESGSIHRMDVAHYSEPSSKSRLTRRRHTISVSSSVSGADALSEQDRSSAGIDHLMLDISPSQSAQNGLARAGLVVPSSASSRTTTPMVSPAPSPGHPPLPYAPNGSTLTFLSDPNVSSLPPRLASFQLNDLVLNPPANRDASRPRYWLTPTSVISMNVRSSGDSRTIQITVRRPSCALTWQVQERNPEDDIASRLDEAGRNRSMQSLFDRLINPALPSVQVSLFPGVVCVPVRVTNSEDFQRSLAGLDRVPCTITHKVGVLYRSGLDPLVELSARTSPVGVDASRSPTSPNSSPQPEQDLERSVLSERGGSAIYRKFLSNLGRHVRLRGYAQYTGGLDRTNDNDGKFAVMWDDAVQSVVFLVATYMPNPPGRTDQLFTKKKRHVGNALVSIVFDEDQSREWVQGTICGNVSLVTIVIKPLLREWTDEEGSRPNIPSELKEYLDEERPRGGMESKPCNLYQVSALCKPEVREIAEFLPFQPVQIVPESILACYVRCLAIGASTFCRFFWTSKTGFVSNWVTRLDDLSRLYAKFACTIPDSGSGERRSD